jgi:predicted nucleic acid-binding protein
LRLHLDTSFLIDWQRGSERVTTIGEQIRAGEHALSLDPIVETEYFAAARITRASVALYETLMSMASPLPLTRDVTALAATWLAPMDERKRRAHFADALIAAVAHLEDAVLITGDSRLNRVFPIAVLAY